MQIDLNTHDAAALRDLLQQRVKELDKEINRTDSFAYKHQLQELDRTIERILGELTTGLRDADTSRTATAPTQQL
jgi:predicted transcriptional regulator